jgi:hypothetical protein
MTITEILHKVTIDSKDNGTEFTDTSRLDVIKALLRHSPYRILHEGKLSVIYGKRPLEEGGVVLISSHIDTVYNALFCAEHDHEHLHGTFDNSLTNACVLYDMLQDTLNDNVVIAFTGDEEHNAGGAKEVKELLNDNTMIDMAIVLDVTAEGWDEECPFTLENDLCIDIYTGYRIFETLKRYNHRFKFVHDAEPDESWEYCKDNIPCFTLCLPVHGDMHSDSGTLTRRSALPIYAEILHLLANEI